MAARVSNNFEPGRYRLTMDLTAPVRDGSPVRGSDGPVNIAISREFRAQGSPAERYGDAWEV